MSRVRDEGQVPEVRASGVDREAAYYERLRAGIDRRVDGRCGICQEPIAVGARTVRVDGERCHAGCAADD